MEYLDQAAYLERAKQIKDLTGRMPGRVQGLAPTDRDYLQRYFVGALEAHDDTRYRKDRLKAQPNIELQANQAYERLLAELEVPATLPEGGPGETSV